MTAVIWHKHKEMAVGREGRRPESVFMEEILWDRVGKTSRNWP